MSETFSLLSDILIRVDKTKTIREQIDEGFVTFGCPANWIDYARKHEDGIADKFEAICGHVRKDDPRLSMICDDGVPLNAFRSLWNEDGPHDTVFVRYIYHCLTPALCFYSVAVKEQVKKATAPILIDLRDYYNSLGINREECSVLSIYETNRFFAELRSRIPSALSNNNHINRDNMDDNCRLLAEAVDYSLNLESEFFNPRSLKDIYKKLPKYASQCEARLIIPDVYFTADSVYNPKAYKTNKLNVPVPHLRDYSYVCDAKDANYLIVGDYNVETDDFGVGFVKERSVI